jgi:hypothetical protein
MGCIDIRTDAVREQLPYDGLVRPKPVAIESDFNDILKLRETWKVCFILVTEMSDLYIIFYKRIA